MHSIEISSHIVLTGEDLNQLIKPLLYVWIRKDIILYIGITKHGVTNLRGLERYEAVLDDDKIELQFVDSIQQARKLELELVAQFKPKYNTGRGGYNAGYVMTPEQAEKAARERKERQEFLDKLKL